MSAALDAQPGQDRRLASRTDLLRGKTAARGEDRGQERLHLPRRLLHPDPLLREVEGEEVLRLPNCISPQGVVAIFTAAGRRQRTSRP